MNMFKANGGFTLVELIVVIAILGILATIAIPSYNQYIDAAEGANVNVIKGFNRTASAANEAWDAYMPGETIVATEAVPSN